jgi:FixJ family two-component response regulator
MPGMSGPDLQREVRLRGLEFPIVFITAQANESLRPRVLQKGAIDCLFKPFDESALLQALNSSLSAS